MSTKIFHNAEVGRCFPHEYLEMMGSQLFHTLRKWLEQQGAPGELIEALDCAEMMGIYANNMQKGKLNDWDADDIPATLAKTVQLIKMFGGEYSDSLNAMEFEAQVEWRAI